MVPSGLIRILRTSSSKSIASAASDCVPGVMLILLLVALVMELLKVSARALPNEVGSCMTTPLQSESVSVPV